MDKFIRTSSGQEKDFGLEIKLDWPEEHSFLGKLEDLIICGICKEFYHAPMSAPCGHTFCSKCFRLALAAQQTTQKDCPLCHSYMEEADLRKNIPLEAITTEFQAGRKKLKDSLESLKHHVGSVCEIASPGKSSSLPRTYSTLKKPSHISCPLCNQTDFGGIDPNVHISSCSSQEPEKNTSINPIPSTLKRASSTGSCSNSSAKRPNYMTKPIYDSHARQATKETAQGLSTTGEKSVLQRRHAHYITLHNANCDISPPKPTSALKRELEAWERIHLDKKKSAFCSTANVNIKDEEYLARHNILLFFAFIEIDSEPTEAVASNAKKQTLSQSSVDPMIDFPIYTEDLDGLDLTMQ
ncbi:E3 ubiquitin-protein ligase rad18 [Entomophthora muscae]|uniref:E3 ubiquitin-protein ligase rad18 n=1 Tax=Entomophthora muscae TaxID=34485 RepID=A0ACC2SNL9_9FUNG|nr:E3 ubiquitin-protein ligase rad18 [Entomophthora muscae]